MDNLTVVCAWCNKVLVVGGKTISHGICESCSQKLLELAPEVAVEEEQPAMILKCGCTYGRGRYIKLCWKHGG